jgi:hypothetical protein
MPSRLLPQTVEPRPGRWWPRTAEPGRVSPVRPRPDRVFEATRATFPQPPPQIQELQRQGKNWKLEWYARGKSHGRRDVVHRYSRSTPLARVSADAPDTDAIRGARQSRRHRPGATGIVATYRLHDRVLANRASRRRYAHEPTTLDESQQRSSIGCARTAMRRCRSRSSCPIQRSGTSSKPKPRASSPKRRTGSLEQEGGESALRRRAGKEFLVRKYSGG